MDNARLVPVDFVVPAGLRSGAFVLEPLGVQHNEADHAAWTSSIEHIRQTPGFTGPGWPGDPVSLEQNAIDTARHEQEFTDRTGFAYAVLLAGSGAVIGTVYLRPPLRDGFDVDVRSWVRADQAALDKPLYDLVSAWLAESWPFTAPDYAPR